MKQEIKERVEKIRRGEVPEGYRKTKVGIIPEEWEMKKLGDAAEVVMGQSPIGTSYNHSGTGAPLINGPTEFTEKYPIKIQWTSQPTKFCKKGDILLCVRGSSTGRMNISDEEYCIGRGVAAIRAKSGADMLFITFLVESAIKSILTLTTGSTFPNIDGKSIKTIQFPLPHLSEQQKIAEILSTWDKAIELKEKLIEENKKLKKEAEKLLITGDVRFFSFNNEWSEMRIKDFTIQKPSMRSAGDLNETGLYPVYGASGIAGYDDTFDNDEEYVAIIKDGSGVGRVYLYKKKTSAIGTLTTIKANEKSDIGFVYLLMKNINYKKYITGNAIPHIYYKDYSKEHVKMPSLEEQRKIAHFSKIFNQYIQNLENELYQLKEQKRGLMQLLLTGIVRVEVD
ncbi:MAG: restriction endonuclease subunit S [Deltaproteobacteria bacterium]|nr:restriction endonuclease subunit S [Deltaproteobacteria bacterium]